MNIEVTMADENPIKPGWMTAREIKDEFGIEENTLRYYVGARKVRRSEIGKGKHGKPTITFYWREDVEKLPHKDKDG